MAVDVWKKIRIVVLICTVLAPVACVESCHKFMHPQCYMEAIPDEMYFYYLDDEPVTNQEHSPEKTTKRMTEDL